MTFEEARVKAWTMDLLLFIHYSDDHSSYKLAGWSESHLDEIAMMTQE